MKKHNAVLRIFHLGTAVALAVLFTGLCLADGNKPDMQSIIRETQQMSQVPHEMALVWWIPPQFWRASLESNPRLTSEQINDFLKTIKPYTVVAVVKGKFGSFGGVTYEDEATVRSELALIDHDQVEYKPLGDADVTPDMQNFLSMMKPVFANMLGAMGKNFDIFVFPANGKNGKVIADAEKEGQFWVRLGDEKFRWRLPIGALLAPKICPKCGEKLSGAYKFCPFDGTPLDK